MHCCLFQGWMIVAYYNEEYLLNILRMVPSSSSFSTLSTVCLPSLHTCSTPLLPNLLSKMLVPLVTAVSLQEEDGKQVFTWSPGEQVGMTLGSRARN